MTVLQRKKQAEADAKQARKQRELDRAAKIRDRWLKVWNVIKACVSYLGQQLLTVFCVLVGMRMNVLLVKQDQADETRNALDMSPQAVREREVKRMNHKKWVIGAVALLAAGIADVFFVVPNLAESLAKKASESYTRGTLGYYGVCGVLEGIVLSGLLLFKVFADSIPGLHQKLLHEEEEAAFAAIEGEIKKARCAVGVYILIVATVFGANILAEQHKVAMMDRLAGLKVSVAAPSFSTVDPATGESTRTAVLPASGAAANAAKPTPVSASLGINILLATMHIALLFIRGQRRLSLQEWTEPEMAALQAGCKHKLAVWKSQLHFLVALARPCHTWLPAIRDALPDRVIATQPLLAALTVAPMAQPMTAAATKDPIATAKHEVPADSFEYVP